jgi:predicted hydrolase (HD superfamily)
MLAVEAAMIAYARKLGEDESEWSVCGLLHDFDYEKMKEEHPSKWGMDILKEKGISQDIIDAIMGHGERNNPDIRKTNMARALFAVDELTGFIVAVALMRPNQISDLELSSIKKRFKDKAFAKGVNRDDIYQGAKELNVEIDDHIQIVLDAMKGIKGELGLR